MIRPYSILLIGLLYFASGQKTPLYAHTLSDDEAAIARNIEILHNDDSRARAAAANELRLIIARYPSGTCNIRDKNSGEAFWAEKIRQVKLGMAKAEVTTLLPPFLQSPESMSMGSGHSHSVSYRLDLCWRVTVQYRNPDKVMERPTLDKRQLLIFVSPPKNHTGGWTCWYVNGQKGIETQYKNGKYEGKLISFYDNGTKMYEQHCVNGVADGAETGWYEDGKLSYAAQYRNGKQDGKWTSWYHDGRKQSEQNYRAGVPDGLHAAWYENGQMKFEMNYRNGILHGMEAAWNEKGVAHYKRQYINGKVIG